MKATFRAARAGVLLLFHLSPSPAQPSASTPSRAQITKRILDMLCWKAYWLGPAPFFGAYQSGKLADVELIRSPGAIGVMITSISTNLRFRLLDTGTLMGSFGPFAVHQTNSQAAHDYTSRECADLAPSHWGLPAIITPRQMSPTPSRLGL